MPTNFRPILFGFGISAAVVLLGCSSVSGPHFKDEELNQVKRVAIVGLELHQQTSESIRPKTAADSEVLLELETSQHAIENPVVEDIFEVLRARTLKAHGWEVLPLSEMRKNSSYAEKVDALKSFHVARPVLPRGYVMYVAPGVLDAWAVLQMKPSERKALAEALNVDLVIAFLSKVSLKKYYRVRSQSELDLLAFGRHTGDVVWQDTGVKGSETDDAASIIFGYSSEQKLLELAAQATQLAFDEVSDRKNKKQ